ncbi:hypothetical protein [Sphingomonas mesophila]|uniref:hypothetical protein n=1 Tax=Sphingomonas mesophila TaxID=2303576 RepID=UPI000E585A74|nr:hypothetical protein [Sphingomonas mesophila]
MTFALATAFFLSIAWMIIVALAATFEGKGQRIRAALTGRVPQPLPPVHARFALRYPLRRAERAVMRPRMRAAA